MRLSGLVLSSWIMLGAGNIFPWSDGNALPVVVLSGVCLLSLGGGMLVVARRSREQLWRLISLMAPTTAVISTIITVLGDEPRPFSAGLALSSMWLTGLAFGYRGQGPTARDG